ncbi:lytic murein transglycosylase [Nocardia sp. 2]|uniref:Lytic murein transglycosylase n=1 Tax=Nocardia acididurans TaxID=2802282 RepID=A0ABS1M7D8_9NOCA|nr:lytic murein transglycosylase [Nocardia acididurans]MBL1076129.1 lytic murein transglycosylase [Nocardia acididurans]
MAKKISAPVTASALLIAGLVTAGSATTTVQSTAPAAAPDALLAASSAGQNVANTEANSDQLVGLVPAAPDAPRKLSALTPPSDGSPLFGGTVPLQNIALPGGTGALGIPEIVLAAYRNAELALESSTPGCGLTWNLLAGIGRIESAHASSGRTDAAGTTIQPIYGPALDGTLPGNEIIRASDGGYVRAVGPMQFLPSTWVHYAADGNGDGVSDPNNVFDAALAAGKYLCSGGLDLRDSQQQLKAVLRYNNSMSYAAQVLSWSNAYKTGGQPTTVDISATLVQPGNLTAPVPDMAAANSTIEAATTTTTEQPPTTTTQTEVMITIPGLPPIPCGIFCPAPVQPVTPNCDATAQDPAKTNPDAKPEDENVAAAQQTEQQFGPDGKPIEKTTDCTTVNDQQQQNPGAAQQQPQDAQQPQKTPEPNVGAPAEQAPAEAPVEAAPPTPAAPGITLPFGITIPLPAPAPAP